MINLSEKENLRKIRWALGAMSRDATSPHINQLLLGSHIVATDGRRLHYVTAPELEDKDPVLLPPEVAMALPTLARSAQCGDSLDLEGKFVGTSKWTLNLDRGIEDPAPFPPYLEGVRNRKTDAAQITVKVSEFRQAVAAMPKDSVVVLRLGPDELGVKAQVRGELDAQGWPLWRERGVGHADKPQGVHYIGLNRSYLLDAVKGLIGGVTLHFGKSSLDQLRIVNAEVAYNVYTACIMPMRLTDKELGL